MLIKVKIMWLFLLNICTLSAGELFARVHLVCYFTLCGVRASTLYILLMTGPSCELF